MKIAKSKIISRERFQTRGDADMQEKLVPLYPDKLIWDFQYTYQFQTCITVHPPNQR